MGFGTGDRPRRLATRTGVSYTRPRRKSFGRRRATPSARSSFASRCRYGRPRAGGGTRFQGRDIRRASARQFARASRRRCSSWSVLTIRSRRRGSRRDHPRISGVSRRSAPRLQDTIIGHKPAGRSVRDRSAPPCLAGLSSRSRVVRSRLEARARPVDMGGRSTTVVDNLHTVASKRCGPIGTSRTRIAARVDGGVPRAWSAVERVAVDQSGARSTPFQRAGRRPSMALLVAVGGRCPAGEQVQGVL